MSKHDGYILTWSNAFAQWNRAYYRTLKNSNVRLDANQVLAYATKDNIDLWLFQKKLIQLPLYENSFEFLYLRAKKA